MNPQDQPAGPSRDQHESQPGQSTTPNEQPASPAASLPAPNPALSSEAEQGNLYNPRDSFAAPAESPTDSYPEQTQGDTGQEVVWTASEFIAHDKSPGWYLGMIGASLAVVVIIYLITRDIFSSVIVAIATGTFGIAASRQPRQLQYGVNDHGVGIGRRFFPYEDFRSFSVVDEGAFHSIVLMPLKRFLPPITIYFDPDDESLIEDILNAHLPLAQHEHELTERLMRRIRF
jgi:hypothetical protein